MSTIQAEVTFRSTRFTPVLPEESQVNPGRYGAELAYWLCTELAHCGVITSYPEYEDWGWFIEYITDAGDEFWLCCGNLHDSRDQWHCFLQSKSKGLFRRKPPLDAAAEPLLNTLRQILETEDSISDVQWTDD